MQSWPFDLPFTCHNIFNYGLQKLKESWRYAKIIESYVQMTFLVWKCQGCFVLKTAPAVCGRSLPVAMNLVSIQARVG